MALYINGDKILGHSLDIDAHVAELLAYLLRGANILPIPTNAGWSESSVNGGGATSRIGDQQVYVQATANGRGLMSAVLFGFNVGDVDLSYVDWDKKLYIIFGYARTASDAEVIARFQLKEVVTEGALAAKGIGIRADNYALQGESYGTALGVVDLGVTLTTLKDKKIVIIHDPSVPKIEWYVDGVLKGTQSTAANIPSGSGTAEGALVHSIVNGATGGTTCRSYIFAPWIWQAR